MEAHSWRPFMSHGSLKEIQGSRWLKLDQWMKGASNHFDYAALCPLREVTVTGRLLVVRTRGNRQTVCVEIQGLPIPSITGEWFWGLGPSCKSRDEPLWQTDTIPSWNALGMLRHGCDMLFSPRYCHTLKLLSSTRSTSCFFLKVLTAVGHLVRIVTLVVLLPRAL